MENRSPRHRQLDVVPHVDLIKNLNEIYFSEAFETVPLIPLINGVKPIAPSTVSSSLPPPSDYLGTLHAELDKTNYNLLNQPGIYMNTNRHFQNYFNPYSSMRTFLTLGQVANNCDDTLPPILYGYKFKLKYEGSKGPTKKRRIVMCDYEGCSKQFTKAWNFVDHARMHVGEKPFACHLCTSKFTQKGNLKKHMKKHYRLN